MYEINHVDDCLEEAENILIVSDSCIKPDEELSEVSIFHQSGKSYKRIVDTEFEIQEVGWHESSHIVPEPSIMHIVPNCEEIVYLWKTFGLKPHLVLSCPLPRIHSS